jgi:hypothetical protein
MFPRESLPPPKPLMIIRLLHPKHLSAFFNFDQDTSQILQALVAPVGGEKPCIAIVERMFDAFDYARAGLWIT